MHYHHTYETGLLYGSRPFLKESDLSYTKENDLSKHSIPKVTHWHTTHTHTHPTHTTYTHTAYSFKFSVHNHRSNSSHKCPRDTDAMSWCGPRPGRWRHATLPPWCWSFSDKIFYPTFTIRIIIDWSSSLTTNPRQPNDH